MMLSRMFPTPEAAAMDGFPTEHCRVLAVDADGDDAFVVLDTGPTEYRYLYSGTVERVGDGWIGGIDSNGGGVRKIGHAPMRSARSASLSSPTRRPRAVMRCVLRGAATSASRSCGMACIF